MADIIERNATCARQLLECAAEIERLRAVLREIAAYYDGEFGVSNYQAKLAERALNEQKADQK